ncbi:MAG: ribonuclease domain-containing protein, partial [Peptococcaceae bacterium]|nr:ribonuclease domain-containing protein [Peptococcaceae bacterium]
MQTTKKLIALLLSLVMMFGLFVGCTSTDSGSTDSGQSQQTIAEDGTYTSKEDVALYIHTYDKLPSNYITKNEAKDLGWKSKGTLDEVAPGKSIGGDYFGNYEGTLPEVSGRE